MSYNSSRQRRELADAFDNDHTLPPPTEREKMILQAGADAMERFDREHPRLKGFEVVPVLGRFYEWRLWRAVNEAKRKAEASLPPGVDS
jgi:hypothetical protein